jgi:hypothetical protein
MDSYFLKFIDNMTVTIIGLNFATAQQPHTTSSRHDERTDKSRGTTRYSFANNLFDIAFHRGGKRQRSNSASAVEYGLDDDDDGIDGKNDCGLSDIPEAVLADSIQPIFLQLQELDAEELLSLTRVDNGGAILREG